MGRFISLMSLSQLRSWAEKLPWRLSIPEGGAFFLSAECVMQYMKRSILLIFIEDSFRKRAELYGICSLMFFEELEH